MQNLKMCRLCMAQPPVSHSLLESNEANILESLTSIKVLELLEHITAHSFYKYSRYLKKITFQSELVLNAG